mmetsp:Transcript_4438/g.9840  ORF Transcript_4438/g.9840 Transcript_4438/m.9840 type:complete len:247 (+) Transcript_4438:210-950(+)
MVICRSGCGSDSTEAPLVRAPNREDARLSCSSSSFCTRRAISSSLSAFTASSVRSGPSWAQVPNSRTLRSASAATGVVCRTGPGISNSGLSASSVRMWVCGGKLWPAVEVMVMTTGTWRSGRVHSNGITMLASASTSNTAALTSVIAAMAMAVGSPVFTWTTFLMDSTSMFVTLEILSGAQPFLWSFCTTGTTAWRTAIFTPCGLFRSPHRDVHRSSPLGPTFTLTLTLQAKPGSWSVKTTVPILT